MSAGCVAQSNAWSAPRTQPESPGVADRIRPNYTASDRIGSDRSARAPTNAKKNSKKKPQEHQEARGQNKARKDADAKDAKLDKAIYSTSSRSSSSSSTTREHDISGIKQAAKDCRASCSRKYRYFSLGNAPTTPSKGGAPKDRERP